MTQPDYCMNLLHYVALIGAGAITNGQVVNLSNNIEEN